MSQRIWQEAGVFIAKNCEAEDEALEAVATKFKEAKKINTDYVIDSDDDVLSENDIGLFFSPAFCNIAMKLSTPFFSINLSL